MQVDELLDGGPLVRRWWKLRGKTQSRRRTYFEIVTFTTSERWSLAFIRRPRSLFAAMCA